jgi:uncharacterized protein YggU (UPF0235/DUF167 family)
LGKQAGEWKLAVTAPPAEGRANSACIEYLSELLGTPKSAITLIKGRTNRSKVFAVAGLSDADVTLRLEQATDESGVS